MPQAIPLVLTAVVNAAALEGINLILANLAIAAISNMLLDADKPRVRKNYGSMRANGIMPRTIVYGEALLSGPIIFAGGAGRADGYDRGLSIIVALTGHPVEEITSIFLGDVEFLTSNIDGSNRPRDREYRDSTRLFYMDGKDPVGAQATVLKQFLVDKWSAPTNRLEDVAHVAYILYTGARWTQPVNMKARIKGKLVRDPVAMYDAEQAATDPLAVPKAYSNNWAACVLDYLMDPYLGLGIPLSEIDLLYFRNAAILSDEQITVPGSNPAIVTKRYTCDGIISCDETPVSILEGLLTAGFGQLVYTQGKYRLFGGEYQVPLSGTEDTITESDLAGPLQIKATIPRGERFNAVRGTYIRKGGTTEGKLDKNAFSEADFPEVKNTTYKAADAGSDNYTDTALNGYIYKDISLPFTNNEHAAQRIAEITMNKARQGVVLTCTIKPKAIRYSVGDNVKVNMPNLAIGTEVNPGFIAATFGTLVHSAGVVTSIPVTNAGAGYLHPPIITISGGSGTGAIAIPVMVAGSISEVLIIDGGTGYDGTETISISDPTGDSVGFVDKVFKIESWVPQQDGTVKLTLREDSASIYTEGSTVAIDDNPDVTVTSIEDAYMPRNLVLNSGNSVSGTSSDGTYIPALQATFDPGLDPSSTAGYEMQLGRGSDITTVISSMSVAAVTEDPPASGDYTALVNFTLQDSIVNDTIYSVQGHPSAVAEFNFNNNVGTTQAPQYADEKGVFPNLTTS